MFVPLQYQVSEYDCVPTSISNAICYLFERKAVPPMVVRHIYSYSLDTVGPGTLLGRRGTSQTAVKLLGQWLSAYRTKKFAVATSHILGREVHLGDEGPIVSCLDRGGVALINVLLVSGEEHFLTVLGLEEDWVLCFDPYYRKILRGLGSQARILESADGRSPNLAVRRDWMDEDIAGRRFCLGPVDEREALLVWRER